MTGDIETAVHYRYVAKSGEVAKRLGVPVEEVQRALRRLADIHGVVLHEQVCEPWVIHPFSASPTATWVESGNRGWWATCMWCGCGIATLVGGDATFHSRIGGEGEDIDIHVEKGRVRETDPVGPLRGAAAERLGLRPPFLRDRPVFPQSRRRPDLERASQHFRWEP